MQNESMAISESGRRSEIAWSSVLPGDTKLGPVDTAGHPLMNVDVVENFLPLSRLS
jgi:hypothetical protein